MPTTTRELLTGALRLINAVQANEVPSSADMDIALEAMNALMDSKSNDLLNIHTITPTYFTLTPNQYRYTLGPGGDFDTERPMRIEQAKLGLNSVIIDPVTTTGISTPVSAPAASYDHYTTATCRNGYDGDVGFFGSDLPAAPQTGLFDPDVLTTPVISSEFSVSWGMGSGTVPNAGLRSEGTTLTSGSEPFAYRTSDAYLPAIEGDVVTLLESNFSGYALEYSARFIVGPDEFNGDVYVMTGTAVGEDAGSQSITYVETIGSRYPDASFAFPIQSAVVGETVTFTNTTPTGTSFSWDYGDGTTFTTGDDAVTHTYTAPGVYTVTLTVTLAPGLEAVAEAAFTVSGITSDGNTLYLPLKPLQDEEYAAIRQRGLTNNWPTTITDNGGYPLRELFFWPVPKTVQAVELWLWEPLNVYANLDAQLNLPQGYERYLRARLALELAPEFGKEVSQDVIAMTTEAEGNIKKLNQQVPIARTRSMFRRRPTSNYITFISSADTLPEPGDLP